MDDSRCDKCGYAAIEHETETTVSFTCHHYERDEPIGYVVSRGVSPSSCPLRNETRSKTTPESLADAHWKYVKDVLEHAGETPEIIEIIGFHYRTAMVHGIKHGREDGSR